MSDVLKGTSILIVDDEQDLREILSEEFGLLGANVMTASGGREAFDMFVENSPDAVLSDVRMPGGDGVELLRRIRAVRPQPPPLVFLLTGFSDLKAEEAQSLGSRELVTKPFSLRLLRDRVCAALLETRPSA